MSAGRWKFVPVSQRAKQFVAQHYPKAARYDAIVFEKDGSGRPFVDAMSKEGLTFAEEISIAEAELCRLYVLQDPRPSQPSDEEARVLSVLYRITTGIGLAEYRRLWKKKMAGEDTVEEGALLRDFEAIKCGWTGYWDDDKIRERKEHDEQLKVIRYTRFLESLDPEEHTPTDDEEEEALTQWMVDHGFHPKDPMPSGEDMESLPRELERVYCWRFNIPYFE